MPIELDGRPRTQNHSNQVSISADQLLLGFRRLLLDCFKVSTFLQGQDLNALFLASAGANRIHLPTALHKQSDMLEVSSGIVLTEVSSQPALAENSVVLTPSKMGTGESGNSSR